MQIPEDRWKCVFVRDDRAEHTRTRTLCAAIDVPGMEKPLRVWREQLWNIEPNMETPVLMHEAYWTTSREAACSSLDNALEPHLVTATATP